jgi:hypothetical protein
VKRAVTEGKVNGFVRLWLRYHTLLPEALMARHEISRVIVPAVVRGPVESDFHTVRLRAGRVYELILAAGAIGDVVDAPVDLCRPCWD